MGRTGYDDRGLKAQKKREHVSALLLFLAAPLTLFITFRFLGSAKFMVAGLLIVIYAMIPFFMIFERRKPKAREIVLVAMMTALTVTSHLIFHVTVPIEIGTAMVIISGISLGPEAGFLVGALARFVCNFYQGSGAWTPWQMFCWGLLGFLAGIVFNKVEVQHLRLRSQKEEEVRAAAVESPKSRAFRLVMGPVMCVVFGFIVAYISYIFVPGQDQTPWGWRMYVCGGVGLVLGALLQRKRLPVDNITITLFTFFTTLIIYGGIMNAAMLTWTSGDFNTLRLLYVSGFVYDLGHAGRAAACMFVIGKPMMQKIERIKVKYGIYR